MGFNSGFKGLNEFIKYGVKSLPGLMWLMIQSCGGLWWTRWRTIRFHKEWSISWLPDRLGNVCYQLL